MSLLDSEIIKSVYSKQEYTDHIEMIKTSSHVSLYPLHFMIALNVSQLSCATYASKHKDCLVSRDSKLYFVTPLMLAIILEKKEMVQELAGWMNKEDFRVTDEFGFNALHLASIALPSVVSLLEKKSDLRQLTPWNGNHQHLGVLAGHVSPGKSKCRFQVKDEMGKLRDGASLSPENLRSLTGLRELREISLYDSQEGRLVLWQGQKPLSNQEQLIFQTFFEPKLREYNLSPPKLTVKPSPRLLHSSLGLFVDEETAPFTKLSAYGGRFKHTSEESFYVLGKFDGRDIGGLATLVNCGFPNSLFISLHYDGDEHNELFSIRSLSPGEEILISYGIAYTPLKFGRQILLGVDEMETFFKHFKRILKKWINLKKEVADPKTPDQKLRAQFEINALSLQAIFPLYFPNYLMHLWAKGMTPAKFWLDAMDEENSLEIYQNSRMEAIIRENIQMKYHCEVLSELEVLETKNESGCIPKLKSSILESIGIFTYMEIFSAVLITKNELQRNRLNADNFQSFFQTLASDARVLALESCEGSLRAYLKEEFQKNPL